MILSMAGKYTAYKIFTDWIECTSLAVSNTLQQIHDKVWEKREKQYQAIMEEYTPEERAKDDYFSGDYGAYPIEVVTAYYEPTEKKWYTTENEEMAMVFAWMPLPTECELNQDDFVDAICINALMTQKGEHK